MAPITSLKAEPGRPLSFLEHLSSIRKSLERVSLIPWTVTSSFSGLTCFFRSRSPSLSRLYQHRFWTGTPWPLRFLSLRSRPLLPEVLSGWDFHPLLFLCGNFRPLYIRLLGCSFLWPYSRLSRQFSQVQSTAHYRLWGCLTALITDDLNTLGSR